MKKLLLITVILSVFCIAMLGSANAVIVYNLTGIDGDTYVESGVKNLTNYGTNLTILAQNQATNDDIIFWLNSSSVWASYNTNQFIAFELNYTSAAATTQTGDNFAGCTAGLNYTYKNETTLTWAVYNTSLCSSWITLDTYAATQVAGTSYVAWIGQTINTTSYTDIFKFTQPVNGGGYKINMTSKENATGKPTLQMLYANTSEFWISPKAYDELTGASAGNYNVSITNGTNTITFTNMSLYNATASTWVWINNTNLTGAITATIVDYSGLYYPSYYYTILSSTSAPVIYMPYLINKTSANINAPSFYFVNGAGAPVQGVTVTVYKQINGVWTIVRQGLTDATGVVQFYLYNNAQYMINGVYGSYSTSNNTITPTQASYSMVLSMGGVTYQNAMFKDVQYSISPLTLTIPSSTTNQTVTFNVYAPNSNLNYINIVVRNNNNTLLANTTSTSSNGAQLTASFNDSGATLIKVNYTISKVGFGPYTLSYNYAVSSVGSGNYSLTSFLTRFGADTSIPDIWKQVISIMVTIAIMGFVIRLSSDLNIGSIIGCIMLTFFGILGWFPWLIIILIWLIVVGIIIMGRGL